MLKSQVHAKWYGGQLEEKVLRAITAASEDSANNVLVDAKKDCPVQTGDLYSTGRVLNYKRKYKQGKRVAFGGKKGKGRTQRVIEKYLDKNFEWREREVWRKGGEKVDYAYFVERDQMFMRKALKKNRSRILRNFSHRIK
jgi:hypothetical protein